MGEAISAPLYDGRTVVDNDGKEHTVLYSADVFIDVPDSDVNLAEGVVLLDSEWDIICVSLSDFEQNFSEIPESMYTQDMFVN